MTIHRSNLIPLVILPLLFCACVSTIRLSGTDSYQKLNEQGKEYRATIIVADSLTATEYDADFVTVGRDSTHWLDPKTQTIRSTATSSIRSVTMHKHAAGTLLGFCLGTAGGYAVGASLPPTSYTSTYRDMTWWGWSAPITYTYYSSFFNTIFATAGGMLVGTITGAIVGTQDRYLFNNTLGTTAH